MAGAGSEIATCVASGTSESEGAMSSATTAFPLPLAWACGISESEEICSALTGALPLPLVLGLGLGLAVGFDD